MNFTLFPMFLVWITALATAACIAPLVILLYKRIGWVDDPHVNRQSKTVHTTPVPRGGGLVVAAGMVPIFLLLFPWNQQLWGVVIAALMLLISGTLDDHYDLNPYLRYVINLVAAGVVIFSGVGIEYITNPIGSGVIDLNMWIVSLVVAGVTISFSLIADAFALIWIVWNMNAVNWSKGVDGQLPGFVSLAALFIAVLSLRFQGDTTQGVVTLIALAVSGAYAGLLIWNFYPQKMMPGYAGGSLAGFFLAVLAILSGAKIATLFLLLAVPTADGIFTVTRRLAAGRSPFWGDRGHLHHRMLDAGWGKRRISLFYMLTTFAFGCLALQLNSTSKLYAMMAAAILFAALILWFTRSITSSKQRAPDSGSKT